MRRKNSPLLPVLLLLATTLAIGAIAFGLLWREAARLEQMTDIAALEQTRAVAENIGLTVAEAKSALIDSLQRFEGPDFAPQLDAWQREEPLAAFTFLWRSQSPNAVSIFSDDSISAPALKADSGQWLWQAPPKKLDPSRERRESRFADAELVAEASEPEANAADNFASNTQARQQIKSQSRVSSTLAIESARAAKSAKAPAPAWTASSTNWIPQQVSGYPHWIGLVTWNRGQTVTGVALDLRSLRDPLLSAFPQQPAKSVSNYSIHTPSGELFLRSGDTYPHLRSSSKSFLFDSGIDLGPELTGWTLRVHRVATTSLADILLSPGGVGTAAILLAIAACGLWLAWQSRSSQLDAAQKVTFVSNVSHELKTPLTTIRMYSEVLQTGRVSDETKRRKYMNTIASESQRLTRMVNNVLDFGSLERGRAKTNPTAQPLAPFLQLFVESRRDEIQSAAFDLNVSIDLADTQAVFDADALTQILNNLVDNSLKYARDGKAISLSARSDDGSAIIELADNGPGLPRHLRSKRFKAFQRGDTSLVAETSGFGLGLSIAQSLAESMGARLHYLHPSSDAERPRFRVTLPLARPPS